MSEIMLPYNIRAIVDFCSEEVRRQRQGPLEVGYMVDAWLFMMDYAFLSETSVDVIREVGKRVEPVVNRGGFRTYPIQIGGEVLILNRRDQIERALENLVEAINEKRVDPQTAYEEFEMIHPFGDGNGRTGKILYAWMTGRMWKPEWPENRKGWYIP